MPNAMRNREEIAEYVEHSAVYALNYRKYGIITAMEKEKIIESTAKLLLNVFSDKYDPWFESQLVAGGGGNSMFVNAWAKPSAKFIRIRISKEAEKRLAEHGYSSLNDIPKHFLRHNAKGADNRREAGKELHADHNPGNTKVLHLIRDKVRSYDQAISYDEKLEDLKSFIREIQTLDIITIEQDDIRTLADSKMTKSEKNMLSGEQRDILLHDSFDDLPDDTIKSVY
jgi:hypothetical protein